MLIIAEIKKNKKYSNLHPNIIERIVKKYLKKYSDEATVAKHAKSELFKVHTSFFTKTNYERELQNLKVAYATGSQRKIKAMHEEILKRYDPRRVWLIEENFYEKLFEITGVPKTIVDIGSGLHPLVIPFMNFKGEYYAYDVNKVEIDFLNEVFKLMNLPELAFWQDCISEPPKVKCDVAMLFKIATAFEWQEKGSFRRVVDKLNAKHIVISIPMRGMQNLANEEKFFYTTMGESIKNYKVTKIVYPKELFFILEKQTKK